MRYVCNGNVFERLISLRESANLKSTGSELFNILSKIFADLLIDWENCLVGQSYDGAQNMRGQLQGLHAYVQKKCPSATFIWCYAHR